MDNWSGRGVAGMCIFLLVLVSHTQGGEDRPCKVVCKVPAKKKPVCASDRQSYPSKCEVRRQKICFGRRNLEWVHEGECKVVPDKSKTLQTVGAYGLSKQHDDKTSGRNCTTKRLAALRDSQKYADKLPGAPASNVSAIMIPRCKADGSYAEIQCHPSTGHCWCVLPATGVAIPQTTMQGTKPNCGSKVEETSSSKSKLACSDTDRALFNKNLLSRLSAEYNRVPEETRKRLIAGYGSIQGMTVENSKVATWRFNSLDKNGDKQLTPHELKELKRDVRKNVKPKDCSKLFFIYCDRNANSLITYQEWNFCLGGNTHLSFHLFLSLSAMGPQDQLIWGNGVLPIQDQSRNSDSKDEKNSPELMAHQKRLFNMLSGEASNKDKDKSSGRLRNANQYGGNDRIDRSPLNDQKVDINRKLVSLAKKTCNDERVTALAEMNDHTYVPRCQSDGRYESTQCHSFTGYCWCVQPGTGRPILGTSALKERPKCDGVTGTRVTSNTLFPSRQTVGRNRGRKGGRRKNRKKLREIPGCPSPNHGAFLTQLVDLLTKEMASAGGSLPAQLTSSANMSLEEKAIRWKAIKADKNSDKKLSKREMRFVRHMVKEKKIKAPEKCAKKFMRYCDINRDNYLTVDELLICTDVRRKARRNRRKQQAKKAGSSSGNIRHSANRNPFTDLLKPSQT